MPNNASGKVSPKFYHKADHVKLHNKKGFST